VLYSSSGAEAVEGAMKLARAATGRSRFVSCDGGFHGTNPGALSLMGADRLRRPFEPLLPNCARVPFGDLTRLADALAREDVAAFVVEPIQGEGGAVLPPPGYLKEAAALCRKHGTLFVADEIQTGLGRTGSFLACDEEGVIPDVVTLAKGLSGGIVPIAATVTTRALHRAAYGSMDRFDLHSSTFAGSALGCTAALETLRVIDDEKLAARAAAAGLRLRTRLARDLAGHPLVREVRGRGLLLAVELGPVEAGFGAPLAEAASKNVYGQWAALKLLEAGFVAQPASHSWNVLKLTPPLILSDAEADDAAAAIARVLGEYRSIPKVLADAAVRAGRQALRGWEIG
jgi:putrescine aminotransferase